MATTIIKSANSDNQALVDSTGHLYVTTAGGGVASDVNVAQIGGAPIALGQAVMADSVPVVIASDQSPLPIAGAITGSVTPAGLRIAGRNTCMNVLNTATLLPAVALANRNAMAITNLSSEVLYIGFDTSVTANQAIGNNAGWEIGPNEGFNIDITNNIPLYGIVPIGPALIKIMELS